MAGRLDRRDVLKALGGAAASLAAPRTLRSADSPAPNPSGGPDTKPNIVLIMADDLGYGDVGCYGGKAAAAPTLDALARGGIRFTDFHSNGAVCSPTRAALLTGRYQQRCGIEGVITAKGHRHTGMALEETTFAEVLKAAGYATAVFGKWHLGYQVQFNPTKQGFDEFRGYVSGNVDYHSHIDQAGYDDWWADCRKVPEAGYTTDLITTHGVRFIERHKDRPFCLYLPHESPHSPFQGRKDKPQRLPGKGRTPAAGRKGRAAAYREMIEVMDEGIGKIVQTVKRLGLERRTLIVFCSDNGPAGPGSAGPLRGGKATLWEGGHRVPGIAYWPGTIVPGSVTHETAMTMDLFATMAAAARTPLPKGLKLDGVNLLPVLTGEGKLPARTLFWRHGRQKAVRKGRWKLLVDRGRRGPRAKGRDVAPSVGLFDLAEDLGEKTNLAAQKPQLVEALQAELAAWEKEVSAGVTRRS